MLALFILISVWSCRLPGERIDLPPEASTRGFDTQKLERLLEQLADRGTRAFLLVRGGEVVYEGYWNGARRDQRFATASAAKALVGGLALALEMDDGLLSADALASTFIPVWESHPQKGRVTIRHLGTHRSGLPHRSAQPAPWERAFWNQDRDALSMLMEDAQLSFEPGSRYSYSGPGYGVLSCVLHRALQGSPYANIRESLEERVMTPLGIPSREWELDESFVESGRDPGVLAVWSGAFFTASATAKIGLLMLHNGSWKERQLISASSVVETTRTLGVPLSGEAKDPFILTPSMGWWTNANRVMPSLPEDAFLAAGAGHQILLVVPSYDLVVVRYGSAFGSGRWDDGFWTELHQYLVAPLMESLRDPLSSSSDTGS